MDEIFIAMDLNFSHHYYIVTGKMLFNKCLEKIEFGRGSAYAIIEYSVEDVKQIIELGGVRQHFFNK